jgi:hypothetical protein
VLPLKDKGVRDGGRQDTIEVTVESMVEVRLLQMFPRGCRAQSAERRAQSTVARVSMWVFSDSIGPCSGCRCRGEGSGRGLWW